MTSAAAARSAALKEACVTEALVIESLPALSRKRANTERTPSPEGSVNVAWPLIGDAAQHITRIVATAFRIGIQLSAPFLVFGLLFNLGLGILSRLIPQMQVFFIGLPLSIILGLLLLVVLEKCAVIGSLLVHFDSRSDLRLS